MLLIEEFKSRSTPLLHKAAVRSGNEGMLVYDRKTQLYQE